MVFFEKQALKEFPDLGVEGSDFNKAFLKGVGLLRQYNPKFFASNEWPLTLARAVAEDLKVASERKPLPPELLERTEDELASEPLANLCSHIVSEQLNAKNIPGSMNVWFREPGILRAERLWDALMVAVRYADKAVLYREVDTLLHRILANPSPTTKQSNRFWLTAILGTRSAWRMVDLLYATDKTDMLGRLLAKVGDEDWVIDWLMLRRHDMADAESLLSRWPLQTRRPEYELRAAVFEQIFSSNYALHGLHFDKTQVIRAAVKSQMWRELSDLPVGEWTLLAHEAGFNPSQPVHEFNANDLEWKAVINRLRKGVDTIAGLKGSSARWTSDTVTRGVLERMLVAKFSTFEFKDSGVQWLEDLTKRLEQSPDPKLRKAAKTAHALGAAVDLSD